MGEKIKKKKKYSQSIIVDQTKIMERKETQCKWFDMTYHQSFKFKSPQEIIAILDKHCDKWGFQYEEGETGALHYQIRVSMKVKIRASTIPKNFEEFYAFHIRPTTPTMQNNFTYVTKEATRIDGPWHYINDAPQLIPRQCREIMYTLFPWQQHIHDSVSRWESRIINLVYAPEGCEGKSSLAMYLLSINKAFLIPVLDDYKDLMQAVCCMILDQQKNQLVKTTALDKMFIIDIPRALETQKQKKLYSAIETIKGGLAFDTRNHYKCVKFDSPVVWVFTNHLPSPDLLTKDRWVYWTINRTKQLVKTDYSLYLVEQQAKIDANDRAIKLKINPI